jgi:hypothetical protein
MTWHYSSHEQGGEGTLNDDKQSVGHKKVNEIDYNIMLICFQYLPESVGIFFISHK